jgi:hypothetical protein
MEEGRGRSLRRRHTGRRTRQTVRAEGACEGEAPGACEGEALGA